MQSVERSLPLRKLSSLVFFLQIRKMVTRQVIEDVSIVPVNGKIVIQECWVSR